jgi:cytidylate kinase
VLDRGGDPTDAALAEAEARALTPGDLDRGDLRGPEADRAASAVAVIPGVRAALLDWQRDFGRTHGAVMDGRDIGTVIFPDAPAKLFVTASPEARAKRRWLELRDRGVVRELAEVEAEMRARDAQDAGRETAPMKPAADAVVLDTTGMDAEAAFAAAVDVVRGGWKASRGLLGCGT